METAETFHDVDRREETAQLGLWMFLATVTMLFAAFTSAYLVRQGGDDWNRVDLPGILWVSTLVLAASSIAVERARQAAEQRRWTHASAAMAIALALGASFLAIQAVAWRSLMAAGVYLPSTPHSSFFYLMTGAHGVHVLAALLVLLWGALRTWDGTGRRDPDRWRQVMSRCRTFWHFLLGVWIYLFVVLSIL
jgi:cytochrome c oxidase subunit III